jgi:hypothetical protein
MWKVIGGILIFLAGVLVGAQGMKYEMDQRKQILDAGIILKLPKDRNDFQKQLLYYSAALGMLTELDRQWSKNEKTITLPKKAH